jgi:hypothetical protein
MDIILHERVPRPPVIGERSAAAIVGIGTDVVADLSVLVSVVPAFAAREIQVAVPGNAVIAPGSIRVIHRPTAIADPA